MRGRSGDPHWRDPSGGSGGPLSGAVSDGDLRRAGLSGALRDPGTPEDLADHLCLSHTVWTARNEWRLPGIEGEVRWKRDAILRCNDGYALRQAAIAGAGLLMQPEVLLADALASGSLVRVLEAWTPQPRPVHLLWRQDRRPLPKLDAVYCPSSAGMADALTMTRASE